MRPEDPVQFPTLASFGGELERAAEGHQLRSGPSRRSLFLAAACAIVALALLGTLTGPGRAVADQIGELVGIGDEPSEEFGFSMGNTDESDSNVIAVGETPSGVPFELAGTTSYEHGDKANGTTCVYLSYPTLEASGNGASCLTAAALQGVNSSRLQPYVQIGPADLGSDSDLLVTGSAGPEVAAIEITYSDDGGEEHTVDATIGELTAGNSGRPNLPGAEAGGHRVQSFVGFLPTTILGEIHKEPTADNVFEDEFRDDPDVVRVRHVLGTIHVTAYGADGGVIAQQSLGDIPNLDLAVVSGMEEQQKADTPDG